MATLKNRFGLIAAVFVAMSPFGVYAGEVLDAPPATADVSAKYLFYMHGRYIERRGADGDYKYEAILNALADKGLVVIGEIRGDTNPRAYPGKIAGQVKSLLNAGVPAGNVTIAGHSKGGFMSMLTASRLRNKAVKYGVLAGCAVEGSKFRRSYMKFSGRRASGMRGRFLVAWDADDDVARECDLVMRKAGVEYRNLEFKTGRGHQLFYAPEAIWIEPLAKFALSD